MASANSNRLHPDCPLAVDSSPLTGDCWSARHFFIYKRQWISVDLIDMGAGTIRTLIVDDEPIARRTLHEELEIFADVEIVGEAENGKDALRKIGTLRPDLVFLDLQMPLMSGFEVARGLGGSHLPVIVIVTAFDQHALEAFDAGAIDYLLKPVSGERLQTAMDRARQLLQRPIENANQIAAIASEGQSTQRKSRKVIGRSGADYILLDADEVLAFQAERELVWIITAKQRLLATQSLRAIQDRLGDPQFQRFHRNAIVNVDHIRKMSALSSQRWLVTLSNALQIVVSKRQARNIRQILHW
jgi:two-component system, LytTR family, response regulator